MNKEMDEPRTTGPLTVAPLVFAGEHIVLATTALSVTPWQPRPCVSSPVGLWIPTRLERPYGHHEDSTAEQLLEAAPDNALCGTIHPFTWFTPSTSAQQLSGDVKHRSHRVWMNHDTASDQWIPYGFQIKVNPNLLQMYLSEVHVNLSHLNDVVLVCAVTCVYIVPSQSQLLWFVLLIIFFSFILYLTS